MIWSSPYFIFGSLVVYLAITIWIVYVWRSRVATEEDFYVAGRTVGYIPNSFSIVATVMSGGIYLGTVGWFYLKGIGFLGYGFAYAFMVFPLWYIGRRLWPVGKAFNYSTAQDFYGDFYQSDILRLLGAIGSIIFLVPYFASNAVAMGTILERFASIPYVWGVIILLVIGVGYTLWGGMRGVIYTDVFQGALSLGFGVVAVITLLYLAGGFTKMMDTLPAEMTHFSPDAVSCGLFFGWFIFMASHPLTMSDRMTRMYTIRSLDDFRRNVVLTGAMLLLMVMIFAFLGLSSHIFAGPGQRMDQAILITIQQQAPWLMVWLVVVVWACGMSTLDSGLVGANAMLSKDIIRGYIKKDITQERSVLVGKWAMLVFGVLAFWIALARPPYVWALIKLVVMFHMQFLPLLIGALYWKRASKLGAEIGWIAGVVLGVYYTFISAAPPPINVGGAPAPGVFGLIVNTVLFVVISLAVSPVPAEHRARFEEAWSRE
ncbi:MAG: sodium:solute symporter [Nitrospinota bacterium]